MSIFKKIPCRICYDRNGFTLIELLVVVITIGLLAGLVAPKFFGKLGTSRLKTAKAQIELFGSALDEFRLDNGRHPTTEEGLEALRKNPAGLKNWAGPYLPKAIPKDPWVMITYIHRRGSMAITTS